MEDKNALLKDSLRRKRDDRSLAMLKEDPSLCDEEVICLALDYSCLKTIRYLREHDLITAEGKEERDRQRLEHFVSQLGAFRNILEGNNNGNKTQPKGGHHGARNTSH